jgi:hypothetical protein
MRAKLAVTALLLLAACKKTDTADDRSASAADSVSPAIDVTAAPGVAFRYDYRFQLPPTKIAAAQEAHQQACERLGVAQCRITGWHYQVIGQNDIQGSLSFLLDPRLARAFGKEAATGVTSAGGKLAEAEITGTDAGAAIKAAQGQQASARAEVERIDRQLARAGLPQAERAELESQRAQAGQQTSEASVQVASGQASLATTPMSFEYRSGPVVGGFDASAPFTSAANLALASVQVTLATLLSLIAFAGPPALALLAAWWLVRLARRRFRPAAETA